MKSSEEGEMNLMVTGNRLVFFLILISLSFTNQGTLSSGELESVVTEISNSNDTVAGEGENKDTSVPKGPPAMKVHIDPLTGEFLEGTQEIVPEELPMGESETVITSPDYLEEVESDMPGGGVMIDLKGRFRSYQNAVKDKDGNVSIECDDDPLTSLNGNSEETGRGYK